MVTIFRYVMVRYLRFIPVWLVFISLSAQAGEVSFSVSAPPAVSKGDRFRVTWTLNTRPDEFHAPSFDGFSRISGPSTSSSTSTQIINNQVTTTVTYSYTYVLQAEESGSFALSAARALIDGREHASDEARIEVTDAPARPAQPRQPEQQQAPADTPGPDDIFVRTEVSTSSPFQGQQVIVSYRLYTRLSVQNYNIERLPGFHGLWSENITPPGQAHVTRENIDGTIYNVAEIRRVAVFPQRSGEIHIDPMEVDLTVRMRREGQRRPGSLFDDFFGSSPFDRFENISHKVRSEPLSLQVRPLPASGHPESFTGLVGKYTMEATLEPGLIDVNDATSLTVTLSGEGNLRMAEIPVPSFPRHLDVFAPQVRDDIQMPRTGIEGSRSFEHVIIPRNTGTFTIPAIELTYFDPDREQYITQTAGPFVLEVEGDPIPGEPAASIQDRWLTEDIRFIHTGSVNWQPKGELFYGSLRFMLLLILPVVLLVVFLVFWRHHRKQLDDIQGLRTRKARKVAVKRLKNAEKLLKNGQKEAFFEEIFRALWGYVSERLNIPVSKLSKENVSAAFKSKNIPYELADRFLEGLHECEYARFAPAETENPMEATYKKALDTIITIEKELRKNNR